MESLDENAVAVDSAYRLRAAHLATQLDPRVVRQRLTRRRCAAILRVSREPPRCPIAGQTRTPLVPFSSSDVCSPLFPAKRGATLSAGFSSSQWTCDDCPADANTGLENWKTLHRLIEITVGIPPRAIARAAPRFGTVKSG